MLAGWQQGMSREKALAAEQTAQEKRDATDAALERQQPEVYVSRYKTRQALAELRAQRAPKRPREPT